MFFAFDILFHKGRDLTKQPLSERRRLLRSIVRQGKHVEVAAWSSDLDAIERFVREHKLEGIVAKSQNGRFESGRRSGAWVKLRYNCSQDS